MAQVVRACISGVPSPNSLSGDLRSNTTSLAVPTVIKTRRIRYNIGQEQGACVEEFAGSLRCACPHSLPGSRTSPTSTKAQV